MNTADAVRLISMLEEIAEQQPSDTLYSSITQVLQQIRACIPPDQLGSFDRYCAMQQYQEFYQRMDSGAEAVA